VRNSNISQNPIFIDQFFVHHKSIVKSERTRRYNPKRGLVFEIEPPIQVGRGIIFWCNAGAIGMERVDFMLFVVCSWPILSRGWTDFTPMERIFNPPVQIEVKSLP